MAGDWIKWQRGLSRKPEVLRMSARLGRSRHEIAALLMEVWEWTDEQVADPDEEGNAIVRIESGQARAFIDHLTGLLGFAEAMSAENWISFRSAHVAFPNWGRHNGKSAKRRALDAERKRSERSDEGKDVRKPSASKADKKRTRGEERRVITPSPPTPSGLPPPPPPENAVVATVASASPAKAKEGDQAEADWRNCEHTLRLLGLASPADACAKARGAGASPNDVLAVVEVWTKNPGAWTLGALHFRVGACAPGLAADTGWPPKAAAASRAAPREPSAEERQAKDDFACMAIVKAGKRAGKSEDDIEREIRAKGLAEASRRLGWRRTTETVA